MMPPRKKPKRALQGECDHQAERIHNISQLLRAYCLYEKDVEYVVEENKVVIVDQSTGRKMPGRRWSDGLHQAVEAKEGRADRPRDPDARHHHDSELFPVVPEAQRHDRHGRNRGERVPRHLQARRDRHSHEPRDSPRRIPTTASTKRAARKYNAVIAEIKEAHGRGQPVLVGTASVESSELLSRMLKREKIPHSVLNAKYHRQEAEIVANAPDSASRSRLRRTWPAAAPTSNWATACARQGLYVGGN